jgi:hypothetical protein
MTDIPENLKPSSKGRKTEMKQPANILSDHVYVTRRRLMSALWPAALSVIVLQR